MHTLDTQTGAPGIESTMGGGELPDDIGNRIENPYDVGYEGDGKVLKPGATFQKGIFEETLEDKVEDQLVEGFSPNTYSIRNFSSTESCKENGKTYPRSNR